MQSLTRYRLILTNFSVVSGFQKCVILLIDEVKIRLRLFYGERCLAEMAENDEDSKATSMLFCDEMPQPWSACDNFSHTCTPNVHLSNSIVLKIAATIFENAGGTVTGSITDNHKVNQHYCKLFTLKEKHRAVHPLDSNRD